MKHVNKQIELICSNCSKPFEKSVYEISRRKAKGSSTNFFCSRSCSSSYGNNHRVVTPVPPEPQFGNTYRQKYDKRFAWYVSRVCKDHRFLIPDSDVKMNIHDELVHAWTGKCAFTGMDIYLKNSKGICETNDPFHIASVDRIDNRLPYQSGNIQWVSFAMNMARNKVSTDDFKQYFGEFKDQINKG